METPEKTHFQEERESDVDPNVNLAECRVALAKSNKKILAFYSNPLWSSPQASLNLTHEMSKIAEDMNPFDYHISPYTTPALMKLNIERYNPEIVCYFGHAQESGLLIDNPDAPPAICVFDCFRQRRLCQDTT